MILLRIMSFKILNIKHHPKIKYNARVFDTQEGYSITYSLRSGELLIETGAYLHWNNRKIFGIAIDISTMSGCICKCKFCASADFYKGTLTCDEIVEQAVLTLMYIKEKRRDFFNSCNLITFAFEGMGESSSPVVSKNILKSIGELKLKFAGNSKKIQFIISTSGLNTSVIRKWADKKIPLETLQLSVHAVSTYMRKLLIGEKHSKISDIIDALIYFHKKCPNVIIKINYLMLKTNKISNVSRTELDLLISLLKETGFLLKLSHLNLTKPAISNNISKLTQKEIIQSFNYIKKIYPNTYIYGTDLDLGISCGQIASYIK